MMHVERAAKLTRERHFFRFWMPYLFQKIEVDGVKWVFLPLNRNYKPLGVLDREHVDYQTLASSHGVKFSRNPALLTGVWTNVSEDGSQLWLYSDTPTSRADYFDRFEKIMALALPILAPDER
jgi:hypothetical protein